MTILFHIQPEDQSSVGVAVGQLVAEELREKRMLLGLPE